MPMRIENLRRYLFVYINIRDLFYVIISKIKDILKYRAIYRNETKTMNKNAVQ